MKYEIRGRMIDGSPAEIWFEDLGRRPPWNGLLVSAFTVNGKTFTSGYDGDSAAGRLAADLRALGHQGVSIGSLEMRIDGGWAGMPIPWAKHRLMVEGDFQ